MTRRLERDVLAAGHRLVRVPTRLMAQARAQGRQPGKSDPIDAEAVALAQSRCWLGYTKTWSGLGSSMPTSCGRCCASSTLLGRIALLVDLFGAPFALIKPEPPAA